MYFGKPLVLANFQPLLRVLQNFLRRRWRSIVQMNAVVRSRNLGIPGQGFPVDNHEFGAAIGRRQMKHANPRGFLGKSQVVLRKKPLDGGPVGSGIVGPHGRIVGNALYIVDKLQAANVRGAIGLVVVGHGVAGQKMFELHPVKALHRACTRTLHEHMLFRVGISVKIDDLPAHIAEVLAKDQIGSRQLL